MPSELMIDAVRAGHLLAVAVGLGGAVIADLTLLRSAARPVSPALTERLRDLHGVIAAAVLAMWVTGLALIWVRTGFVLSEFSPKLIAKLVVVTILSLNAVALGSVFLPLLEEADGQRPLDLPSGSMALGAVVAAASTASWLLALALGASAVLKTGSAGLFVALLPAAYGAALGGAVMAVLVIQLRALAMVDPVWERRAEALAR